MLKSILNLGEKPFKCNYCEIMFRQNSSLKRHEMLHRGDFYSFIWESNFNLHKVKNLFTEKLVAKSKKMQPFKKMQKKCLVKKSK